VPSADTSSAGASPIGAAVANFGAQLADTSVAIKEQIKRHEAVATSQKYALQDRIDADAKWHELNTESRDGFVYERDPATGTVLKDDSGVDKRVKNPDNTDRTITQEFRDWANDRYQKNQLALPSDMAQEMYRAQAGDYFTNQFRTAQAEEHVKRTNALVQQLSDQARALGTKHYNTPELDNASFYDDYDALARTIKSYSEVHVDQRTGKPIQPLMNADQVHNMLLEKGQEFAKTKIDGILRDIRESTDGDKSKMVSKVSQLMDVMAVISGHPVVGLPNYDKPKEGGSFREGTKAMDPITKNYIDTTMTERRQKIGLPAMTDILNPNDRERFAKEIWGMIRGQASAFDLSSVAKMKEQFMANAKMYYNRLPESALQREYANVKNKILEGAGNEGHPRSPIEWGSDLLDMQGAIFEGRNINVNSAYQDPNSRTESLKSQTEALKQSANQAAAEVNKAWTGDPSLRVTGEQLYAIAAEKLQNQTRHSVVELTRKQENDFAGLIVENEPKYNTLWSAFDGKNPDTIPDLHQWYQDYDHRATNLGPQVSKNVSGIPEVAKEKFKALLTPQNGQTVADLAINYRTLLAKAGPDATRLINDLSNSGVLPKEAKYANTYAGSQDTTEDLVQAIFFKHRVDSDFHGIEKYKDEKTDDIKRKIQANYGVQIQGVTGFENKVGGNPTDLRDTLVETIATKAMNSATVSRGALSIDEAIKNAGEEVIGKNYWVSNSGGFFSNGVAKGQLPIPRYQVVPDVQSGPRAYPKKIEQRYINQEDVGRIASFADSLKKDPSQLIDKYGAIMPFDKSGSQKGLTGDAAKRFLQTNGANLREVPVVQHGVLGISFIMDTHSEGGSRGTPTMLQRKALGYTKSRPKYEPVFIPIPTAVETGAQVQDKNQQALDNLKAAPVFKGGK
jgi:hypothetical protein